jgi:hypothetical protein
MTRSVTRVATSAAMFAAMSAAMFGLLSMRMGAQAPAPRGPGSLPAAGRPAASTSTGAKVVGSVRDIMTGLVMPTSDIVFAAAAEAPTTDAQWETLRLNAVLLAESANLLTIGSRARDRGDWLKLARAQLDAAEAVVRLARAKKTEGLSEASDMLYETCPTCHNKYWANRN